MHDIVDIFSLGCCNSKHGGSYYRKSWQLDFLNGKFDHLTNLMKDSINKKGKKTVNFKPLSKRGDGS